MLSVCGLNQLICYNWLVSINARSINVRAEVQSPSPSISNGITAG